MRKCVRNIKCVWNFDCCNLHYISFFYFSVNVIVKQEPVSSFVSSQKSDLLVTVSNQQPSVTSRNCLECSGTYCEDDLLVCVRCGSCCHFFCLHPPLPSVPPGSWCCHICVANVRFMFTCTVLMQMSVCYMYIVHGCFGLSAVMTCTGLWSCFDYGCKHWAPNQLHLLVVLCIYVCDCVYMHHRGYY